MNPPRPGSERVDLVTEVVLVDDLLFETKGEGGAPSPVAPRGGRTRMRSLLGLSLLGGATIVAFLLGRAEMTRSTRLWYRTLKKPSWTPPETAFGIVWPVLYVMTALSGWRVWRAAASRRRSIALGLWAAHMVTNGAWTPIFFGKKEPALALLDIGGNLASAAAYSRVAGKIDKVAGWMMVPYVAWVAFASTINGSIVRHNANGPFARMKIAG